MTETDSMISWQVKRVSSETVTEFEDNLAIEEPLEIRLSFSVGGQRTKKSISVTMRTPGNDDELAVGFLFTEGIIHHTNQVRNVQSGLPENIIVVNLTDESTPDLPATERNFYTTSSCGVCGKSSIDAITTQSAYLGEQDATFTSPTVLYQLAKKLESRQDVFESTGGLHASALFDPDGNFVTLREDVGRHNALDKLVGSMFLSGALPLTDKILLLSGRASFELIQKASMAGIKIVAAIGAPSSLAVKLAGESDITLIGFLKNNRFNIYTGAARITDI